MSFIERLRSGEPEAWGEAFKCLYPVAYAAAISRLGNALTTDCEDVAIETLEDMVKKELAVSTEHELKPLVAAIARNKAADRLRRVFAVKRGGNKLESLESLRESGGSEPVGSTEENVIDQLTLNDLRDLLVGLASQLKKEQRVILRDHYLDQLTYAEIAAKYRMSVNSVGVYLHRALEAMKSIVARNPKLMSELVQLVGEGGLVRVLLPLLSAVQLGRWFLESGVRYQVESELAVPRKLSDEERLQMSAEQLPREAVLQERQHYRLMELAERQFPSQFQIRRVMREADTRRKEAERLCEQLNETKRRTAATVIGLALLALVVFLIACWVSR